MRWKQKAILQRVLSAVPGGFAVNRKLQSFVRHTPAYERSAFLFRVRTALDHIAKASAVLGRPVPVLRVLEFGAGSDLLGPLALRRGGG